MDSKFTIYNTLSRSKEIFEPLAPPRVGLYVCGPTVYGDPHLGHARPAVTYDLLFRYLRALGYRVRYVRNITDVGHLEHDADEGEDKIAKKARLEQLEPMEVAQEYTRRYHDAMRALGVLPPSIEPTASGHVMEQIEMVRRIVEAGYAYEANGSIYFDVEKYSRDHNYGALSGRSLDDMLTGTRALDGQEEKRSPADFALWKKASPEHIMRWPSPWSEGFPGWHMECSAMSLKYLGERFDLHGGGMDLVFPHHEAEMAQNTAACGCGEAHGPAGAFHENRCGARYWMHNNMITTGGQKMGKSLGNFITLEQLFTGTHPLLTQAYSPMTIRFFMLQAHYRSTLDFSNEALQAAEKGLNRLMEAVKTLDNINNFSPTSSYRENPVDLEIRLNEAMNDDLGSPLAIAALFDWVRVINQWHDGSQVRSREDKEQLKAIFHKWVFDILGLRDEKAAGAGSGTDRLTPLVEMVLGMRAEAKADKNWALSDKIRNGLAAAGIRVKDRKDGTSEWEIE
jgi:cysteinyl-tRNA synthetase